MSLTIQDLKYNRDFIIETITDKVGEENVKRVMNEMLKGISCCDTIEELISEAIYFCFEFEVKIEKSKNAMILGRLEQIEVEQN